MHSATPNLFTRDDTFFGVCEGLGEDFGIHPNFLRVSLAGLLFWNPPLAIGIYAAAGAVVVLTRWLVPNPGQSAPAVHEEPEPIPTLSAENEAALEPASSEPEQVPLAA